MHSTNATRTVLKFAYKFHVYTYFEEKRFCQNHCVTKIFLPGLSIKQGISGFKFPALSLSKSHHYQMPTRVS